MVREKFKYSYNICDQYAPDLFERQCKALENKIPGLTKKDLLVDVDGSSIQIYFLNGCELNVVNDYEVGALFINSNFDIEPYFS